jgi:dephospho-CoA kinase
MLFLGQISIPLVIGLSGPTKSGKTQIAKYLMTEQNCCYISMSLPLRKLVTQLGKSTENWMELKDSARMLRKLYGCDYLAHKAIEKIRQNHDNYDSYVVDGLLHDSEIRMFQKEFPKFFLVYIWANDEIRKQEAYKWTRDDSIGSEIQQRDDYEQVYSDRNDILAPNLDVCRPYAKLEIEITDFGRKQLSEKIKFLWEEAQTYYNRNVIL